MEHKTASRGLAYQEAPEAREVWVGKSYMNPEIKSLGQLLDFLGAQLPDVEEGDVFTEAVVLLVSVGEDGETLHTVTTKDLSWIKVAGMLQIAANGELTPPHIICPQEEEES